MSTQNAQHPFDLLPAEQADAGVTEGVHVEAFLQKLAEYQDNNLMPQNRAELLSLLELGQTLDALPEQPTKSAEANRFAPVAQAVAGALQEAGVSTPQFGKQAEAETCYGIAAHLLHNPQLYQACGSMMMYKAAAIQEAQQAPQAPAKQ